MYCFKPFKKYPTQSEHESMTLEAINKKYPLGYMDVPCGNCLGCRVARSRMWTTRIMHELHGWPESGFLTLTYSDEKLPNMFTLKKKELQLFFKRFRKAYDKKYKKKIKYYASAEYGDRSERPHYHSILFGYGINSAMKDGRLVRMYDSKFILYKVLTGLLVDAWSNGYVTLGGVTYDSARYVTQYIDKKYSGVLADKVYVKTNREIPFQRVSHGLGMPYFIKDSERISDQLYINERGYKVGLPKYYKDKFIVEKDRLEELGRENYKKLLDKAVCKGITTLEEFDEWLKQTRLQAERNLRVRLSQRNHTSKKI